MAFCGNAVELFLQGYLDCALWTETDEDEKPLDRKYKAADFSTRALAQARKECLAFMEANEDDLYEAKRTRDWDYLGHDFWLTRNRHGTGFLDRGLGDVGKRLTDAAHTAEERGVTISDGGLEFFP